MSDSGTNLTRQIPHQFAASFKSFTIFILSSLDFTLAAHLYMRVHIRIYQDGELNMSTHLELG